MTTLFTVDGLRTFTENCTVRPRAASALLDRRVPADLAEATDELLPGGLAQHGRASLIDPPAHPGAVDDAWSELVLELTRRAEFPALPSRLTSLFAFEDRRDAQRFRERYRHPDCPIYTVEATPPWFRADARLLGRAVTPLVTAIYARWYWQRRPGVVEPPLWEVLLPLPQVIGERAG